MVTKELRIDAVAVMDSQRVKAVPARLSNHEVLSNIDVAKIECRLMTQAKTKHGLWNIRTVMRSA